MLYLAYDNKISLSILFPSHSLHLLSPQVFGSSCYVQIHTWSLKCVLLGFSRSQEGYKCLSLSFCRNVISTDVTFESSLYFMSTFLCCASATTTITIFLAFDTIQQLCPRYHQIHHRGFECNISNIFTFQLGHLLTLPQCQLLCLLGSQILSLIFPFFVKVHTSLNPSPRYIANSYHGLPPSLQTSLCFLLFLQCQFLKLQVMLQSILARGKL